MSGTDRATLIRVWHLAWPVILSNVTTPLLGLVDTAVVGRLPGPEYIGAVAIGAAAFTGIFWMFGFLRMGTTGFVAQAMGAGDFTEVRAILGRAILIAVLFGALLVTLQQPLWSGAIHLLDPSATVQGLAEQYFSIRVWTGPAALVNYALLGFFIGMQRPRLALAIQIWLNGVNIALDLLFVVGLDMGVPGVAWATLIGEYSAAILGIVVALRVLRPHGGRFNWPAILDPVQGRRLLSANFDIFVRTACLIIAFSWATRVGARLGDLALAANAILMQMVHLLAYGLDGFAFAAEALVGGALGARSLGALREAVVASTIWALIVAVGVAIIYLVGGPLLIAVMTDQPDVQATAEAYLFWIVLYPLLAIWCYQLDGIFIGATQTAEMRNAMILSLGVFVVAILTLPDMFGNHGLWASLSIFNVARTVTLGAYYRRIEVRAARSQPA
ncbi:MULTISPECIES: MATE family efflux transporter [unclassified Minwuia]|uniref:MATE family efflux transporter n=1 Tax=unclassified Minwuia TaxID=2618799 RepID=UPI00247B1000|nr:MULTISPECIES: MATE family efflux transporter [unclassified Minwuia]